MDTFSKDAKKVCFVCGEAKTSLHESGNDLLICDKCDDYDEPCESEEE